MWQRQYTNINQHATIDDVPTPYDDALLNLNTKLNATYIGYGGMAKAGMQQQQEADQKNFAMNKSAAIKRAKVKGVQHCIIMLPGIW